MNVFIGCHPKVGASLTTRRWHVLLKPPCAPALYSERCGARTPVLSVAGFRLFVTRRTAA